MLRLRLHTRRHLATHTTPQYDTPLTFHSHSPLSPTSLSEAKLRLRPSDDHRILRVLAYRRSLIIPLRLPTRQTHPTLANVATTRIILIVMHDRLPEFALIRASKAANLRAGHNELVVIKVVLMAFELRAYTQPLASVRIDVVEMMVFIGAEETAHRLKKFLG